MPKPVTVTRAEVYAARARVRLDEQAAVASPAWVKRLAETEIPIGFHAAPTSPHREPIRAVPREGEFTQRGATVLRTLSGLHVYSYDGDDEEEHLGEERQRARFVYDPQDPYAMQLQFVAVPEVDWAFGREVFIRGLSAPSGEGDVRVQRADFDGQHVLLLALQGFDGNATYAFDYAECEEFARLMQESVPLGSEEHVARFEDLLEASSDTPGTDDEAPSSDGGRSDDRDKDADDLHRNRRRSDG